MCYTKVQEANFNGSAEREQSDAPSLTYITWMMTLA